ncbi:hypothetical protein [Gordonia aichiensis]|uniref:Uncharacterized protein n=1 Tax=Gordonia aichiensis NBRC 108223 TaxID=1220583 RepID=L7KPS7_9ACTN|nr:hypothetical protein [Gordonia aichiensis]GAC49718.1 hypothetical protein GOACH_16_01000 [Gordonia aichiensis NBRC 108223]
MTVLIESNGSHRSRGRSVDATHTIEIAGVCWPAHKLYAVVAAAVAALVVLVVTRSPESAAWSSAATGVAVWFAVGCLTRGQRPGNAATDPAE